MGAPTNIALILFLCTAVHDRLLQRKRFSMGFKAIKGILAVVVTVVTLHPDELQAQSQLSDESTVTEARQIVESRLGDTVREALNAAKRPRIEDRLAPLESLGAEQTARTSGLTIFRLRNVPTVVGVVTDEGVIVSEF